MTEAALDTSLFAKARADRPGLRVLWIHAPLAEDANNAAALGEHLANQFENCEVVLSCQTAPTVPRSNLHIAVEWFQGDAHRSLRKFLASVSPDTMIWFGGTSNATMVRAFKRNGRNAVFVNASAKHDLLGTATWFSGTSRAGLRMFDMIMTVDQATNTLLLRNGITPERLEATGPVSMDSATPPYSEPDFEELSAQLGTRPVWLAMACERSELLAVAEAHKLARRRFHRLLLIVVLADPTDIDHARSIMAENGFDSGERNNVTPLQDNTDVYLAEDQDEVGLWYRLSPVTFMGGTLDKSSGRSPVEPAALGSAIIHGPRTDKYGPIYQALLRSAATSAVFDADSLGRVVDALLAPDKAAMQAHRAWDETSRGATVADRVVEVVKRSLRPDRSYVPTEE